jgi:hypothetical protein
MPPPVTWLSEWMPPDRVEQTQERQRVEAGRLEELLAPRATEVGASDA